MRAPVIVLALAAGMPCLERFTAAAEAGTTRTVVEIASRSDTGGWEYQCSREDAAGEAVYTWNPKHMTDWIGFGIHLNRAGTPVDLSRVDRDRTFLSLGFVCAAPAALPGIRLTTDREHRDFEVALRPTWRDASGRYRIPLSAFMANDRGARWDRVTGIAASTWKLEGVKALSVRVQFPVTIVTTGTYDPHAALREKLGSSTTLYAVTPASAKGMAPGKDVVVTPRDSGLAVSWTKSLWSGARGPQLFLPFDLKGRATVDLARRYPMTFLALTLRGLAPGDAGRVRVGFFDDLGQNSRSEARLDEAMRDGDTWYVPMAAAHGVRLDRVRGVTLAVDHNPEPVAFEVVLPAVLLDNGRRDDRPLAYDALSSTVTVAVEAGTVIKDLAGFGYGGHQGPETPKSFLTDMGFNMTRIGLTRADPADAAAQRLEANDDKWGGHDETRPTWVDECLKLAREGRQSLSIIMPYNEYYKLPKAGRPALEAWMGGMPKGAGWLAARPDFPVRYYELGNEIWNDMKELGGGDAVEGSVVPGDLDLYVSRIRAADPGAKFMASFAGEGSVWPFLMKRLPLLDVLNFSWYGWKDTYEDFRDAEAGSLDWLAPHLAAIRAIDPRAADRVLFGATEYAPHDWAADWPNVDDLGHALWAFDKAAEGVTNPKMAFVVFWPYLWYWWHDGQNRNVGMQSPGSVYRPYDEYPVEDWNLVTPDGRPSAVNRAVRIMGHHRLDEVVACTSSLRPHVGAWATRARDGSRVNLFILNKDYEGKAIRLTLRDFTPARIEKWVFAGEGLNDPEPRLAQVDNDVRLRDGHADFTVPEVSVTMVRFFR